MSFFKNTVGLYISPRTIQIAQLQLIAGKVHLSNFVHVDIFEDEQKIASEQQEELILNALRKAIFKSKINTKRINTVLLPGMVLLRYFQMPRISSEEMEEAVKFEAKKYIPFRLEEAVTGFYVIRDDQETKKMGILSVVTKEETIKNHLALLKKVDINPISIETASFSLIRVLEHAGEISKQGGSTALLYLYAQRMNIIILKNGVPYFIRDLSLAKREEWIDDETAELMAAKEPARMDGRIGILDNLISELKISFDYFKKELGKEEINKILLCGELEEFEDLKIIEETQEGPVEKTCALSGYLQQRLAVTVSQADPLKNIQSPKVKPLPYTFPLLTVTLGAALKGLHKTTVEVDLFKARRAPSVKRKYILNKILMLEVTIVLAVLLAVYLVGAMFVAREKNFLEKEKQQSPKFIDLSAFDIPQLNKGEKEIQSRMQAYNRIVGKRIFLTDKFNGIAEAIPENIWLLDLQYSNVISDKPGEIKLGVSGSAFSEKRGLEVEMINEFAEKLKKDEEFFRGFKKIESGSVTRTFIDNVETMSFSLQCSSVADSGG